MASVQTFEPHSVAKGRFLARPPHSADLPLTTSDELLMLLVAAGAKVIARQASGVLVQIRRRLVLVPATHLVSDLALGDVLRSAAISPQRFRDLRAENGLAS